MNQLSTEDVAFRLAARGVTYVPDFIANAGGLIYTAGMAIHHLSTTESEILTKEAMASAVRLVMAMSVQTGGNTVDAAMRIARERLIDSRARA